MDRVNDIIDGVLSLCRSSSDLIGLVLLLDFQQLDLLKRYLKFYTIKQNVILKVKYWGNVLISFIKCILLS